MSYEPTNWKKGDKVTSTKLNKIENGIQGNDEEITALKEGLSEDGYILLTENDVQQGEYSSSGTISSATSRLCTKNKYPVFKDMTIKHISSSSMSIIFAVFDKNGKRLELSDWITSETESTYTVQHDGYLVMTWKRTSGSYMSVSLYTTSGASTKIYATLGKRVESLTDFVSSIPSVNDIAYVDSDLFEIGSIWKGNNIDSNSRIRTINGIWLPIGTSINIKKYQVLIAEYNENMQYVNASEWVTDAYTTTQPYVRVLIAKIDNSDISSNEIADMVASLNIYPSLIDISGEIHDLNARISDFDPVLPFYWQTYMDTNLPSIISQVRESAMTGDSFVFFTDYHIEYNSGNSHILMRKILDNTPIHKVVFGGDILNGSATKAESYAKFQEFASRFKSLPVYSVRGNHEYNMNDGGSASTKFTENEIYNYVVKPCEDEIKSIGGMYYYADNEVQKIRYIFLDSRNMVGNDDYPIDSTQITWLTGVLSNTESDWTVVMFVHEFMAKNGDTWYVSAKGEQIEDAITASNTDATICAIISGHFHQDYSTMKNGIAYIVTTCDQTPRSAQDRTSGTISELAFDVFTINTSEKTINAFRVGYGQSRSWTYGTT